MALSVVFAGVSCRVRTRRAHSKRDMGSSCHTLLPCHGKIERVGCAIEVGVAVRPCWLRLRWSYSLNLKVLFFGSSGFC